MKTRIRQSTLSIIAWILLFLAGGLMLFSMRMLDQTVADEQKKYYQNMVLQRLSKDMDRAIHLLSDEARNFVVTGDDASLDKYWREMKVDKTREQVLAEISNLEISQAEKELLVNAKKASNELVEFQIRAMRLAAEARGVPLKQMAPNLASYQLSEEEANLNPAAKIDLAYQLVFGPDYELKVTQIESLIDQFQTVTYERTYKVMNEARQTSDTATLWLYLLFLILLGGIGVILRAFHILFARPVKAYTKILSRPQQDQSLDLEMAKTQELYLMAQAFNQRTAQLKESEAKFRNLFELESDAIIIFENSTGRVIEANRAATALYGYSREEMLALKNTDISAEPHTVYTTRWKSNRIEKRLHRKRDGTIFPVEMTLRFFNWQGLDVHIIAVRDITEQQKQEDEARRNEDRIRAFLEVAHYKARDTKDLLDFALIKAVELTGSDMGHIHVYDHNTRKFSVNSCYMTSTNGYPAVETNHAEHLNDAGLWAEAVRTGEPVLINDYSLPSSMKKGHPEEHPCLKRFLSVPVFYEDRIVAVVGVANKETGYNDADIRQLGLLMYSVWNMVERSKTEEALRESEQRFRTLIEKASVGIIIARAHNILYVNPAYEAMSGYTAEELAKLPAPELFLPEHREMAWRHTREQNLRELESYTYEMPCVRKDGSQFWVRVDATAVRMPDGMAEISFVTDITERKRAENEVAKWKKRYDLVAEISQQVVFEENLLTGESIWSRNVEKVFGYAPEEISGFKRWKERLHPGDRESFSNLLRQVPNQEQIYEYEYRFLHKDGHYIDVGGSAVAILGQDGWPERVLGSLQDITRRKRTEEALRESEEKYRELFEASEQLNQKFISIIRNMPLGYLEIDQDLCIRDWNPHAENIYGYKRDEVLGRSIHGLLIEENAEPIVNQIKKQLVQSVSGMHAVYKNINREGESIICNWYLTPTTVTADKVNGCAVMVQDITQQKQAEEALRMAKEDAEKANAAKTEFIANMSHEIRTPLNAVIGFSEILASSVLDERQRDYVESIITAGNGLLTLINDILDLSKIEAGMIELNYAPVDLRKLFKEIEQIFRQKILSKNLQIFIEIEPDLPSSLFLDEARLRQVLLNLVGNAVKFTDKGSIKLTAKKIFRVFDHTLLDLYISVEDTGIGISPEEHDKIFESFRQQTGQSTRKYGGTGLGLTITKKLVETMKGEIKLASTPGIGSIFTVILYNVDVASTIVYEHEAEDDHGIRFEQARVMIVDDIEPNRYLLRELLNSRGLNVVTAENGHEALKLVETVKPDLILMDVKMPVLDGWQTVVVLKNNPDTSEIPIIALTASFSEQDKITKEYPFDGCLIKPVTASKLIVELAKFLKTRPLKDVEAQELAEDDFGLVDLDLSAAENVKRRIQELALQLQGPLRMSRVKEVAQQLEVLGTEHQSGYLLKCSSALHKAVRSYDVETITKVGTKLGNLVSGGGTV